MRCIVGAALMGSAAACASSQQTEERYVTFCTAQGLEPGSELFVDCVQSQRLRDVTEAQRIRDMRGLRSPDR